MEDNLTPQEGLEQDSPSDGHGTVEFLMRRMRHKGDLPAFSQHIIEINSKLSSLTAINFASAGDLAKIILKDFSLTSKLLRVVNSALYGNLAGKVTTISKALFLLGFEKVRMIAATLMIFDHLQNKSQTAELQEMAISAFMSGLIALDVAEDMKFSVKEEAFICAMLHNLGKMLVICYFPEEYAEIKNQMIERNIAEERAAKIVLGITYNMLGITVSRSWNFPDTIVRSMDALPSGIAEAPKTAEDMLRTVSNYSNELLDNVMHVQDTQRAEALADLSTRYHKSISLPPERMETIIESAVDNIDAYCEIIPINRQTRTSLNRIIQSRKNKDTVSPEGNDPVNRQPPGRPEKTTSATPPLDDAMTEQQIDILKNGIQEITDSMKDRHNLSDVMYMILETMYRGLAFYRVIFCMRDATQERMVARFGLGENTDALIGRFQFPIGKSSNVFNIAISQGKGITIDDAFAPTLAKNIPDWYRNAIAAPSFLIYPLIVKGRCIGMFYADKKEKGVLLTEAQRNYMEELRNMAIQTITRETS